MMNGFEEGRPDPDKLLASLVNEEKNMRGKLKIFFGMCAGVGKTYSMLKTARAEKHKGTDIIIGYVETHKRRETDELTHGFEFIPLKNVSYKSSSFVEPDVDAIIARKPHTVIIDELAHTNTPGCRHAKRYQDVLEILENGINVYSTLNVQHLESKSEAVTQISGIPVRETIPDEIFENADEVELIDLTPDELLQRLREGKVYTPDKSAAAIENFFRKGNIISLREMALRIVADRVDKQLHDYMQNKRITGPWKSGLHLLVAIGAGPYSGRLLRWAKSLAYSMGATIQALYVEPASSLSRTQSVYLDKNINLAKQLGIKFNIVSNLDKVKAIVGFANKENITHIIVGKPRTRSLISFLRLSYFLNKLIRYSGDIDVYILGAGTEVKDKYSGKAFTPSFTSNFQQYLTLALFVVLTSVICYFIKDIIGYQTVSFILLFLVSLLSLFYGIGPILLAATSSAFIWDYFFIPPQFTLHIEQPLDVLMLIMFFIIALLNGILTSRVRRQERKIRIREERTNALYQLTKDLNSVSGNEDVVNIAKNYLNKYFDSECRILTEIEGQLREIGTENIGGISHNDLSIAEWVYKNSQKAGKFTNTLPSSDYTFYPMSGRGRNIGVIMLNQKYDNTFGEEQFRDALLSQVSGKLEREYFMEVAKRSFVVNESEKLYKTLFNSISHELRIPVTTILGASETLSDNELNEETREKLYSEIRIASVRLNRLIENLLNMSRLESGFIKPQPDWCDVHDLSSSVMSSLDKELQPFKLSVIIPEEMPLVHIDFGLIERALYNLVLNSTQHSPEGTGIRLKFFYDKGFLVIQIMDRGKGFDRTDLEFVFNKFYRGKNSSVGGSGLGLSIVKGFVEAHNGEVTAENRQNGGAKVTLRIPAKTPELSSE